MFPCPICPKSLTTEKRLKNHLRKKVPCDLKCRRCGVVSKNESQYLKHWEEEHTGLLDCSKLERIPLSELKPKPSRLERMVNVNEKSVPFEIPQLEEGEGTVEYIKRLCAIMVQKATAEDKEITLDININIRPTQEYRERNKK